MEIEFDPAKDAGNREKHGVSLALAAELDWAAAISRLDSRHDYGEARVVSLLPSKGRLFVAVHVTRGRRLRIISLRKANTREVRFYESHA